MPGLILLTLLLSQATPAEQMYVPQFATSFWNASGKVRSNNCYNYSTNRATNNFAQPGSASGKDFDLDCRSVYAAAKADLGLTPAKFFPAKSKDEETLIALVVAPGVDFHWYRRDDNGEWSHKAGATRATNLDRAGQHISSPETAERGRYTDFCGYFTVKNFPQRPDEQDGGYVRIGNMKALPDREPAESTVSVAVYSGLPDPRRSLREWMAQDPQFARQLAGLKTAIAQAPPTAQAERPAAFDSLGYRGLLIDDVEGLVFPAGTRVQVLDRQVWVDGAAPVLLQMAQPLAAERLTATSFDR